MPTLLASNLQSTYGTLYYVHDMKRSVDWYKALGLKASYESDFWTEFSINGHAICLHIQDPQHKKETSGLLILRVNKLNDIVTELKAKQVKVLEDVAEVYPGAGAFRAKIADPDGNIISLYEGPLFSK